MTYGFVPLFKNSIPGFSVAEHVHPRAWFTDGPGVWEWKGPVIRETGCAYGKFFENKAVFIRADLFTDFANYRRDGYDFDARFDDGLASYREKDLYDLLDKSAPVLSRKLRADGCYGKGGKTGFETLITKLQAQCYALISDFVYDKDKNGKPYGWGVGEYSTPEKFFGPSFRDNVYKRKPKESYELVFDHLKELLPDASDKAIKKILSI
ncbi:MAG: hypothetical protein II135_01670 [Clostridia bacterium]|nr:hypothetical protein [Clostridia bacterium]